MVHQCLTFLEGIQGFLFNKKRVCKIIQKSSNQKKTLFINNELYGCKILDIVFGKKNLGEVLYNFFQGLNHIHHIYIWQLLITRKNGKNKIEQGFFEGDRHQI
jgi:hypothetical protein